jgi:hypothetical protein
VLWRWVTQIQLAPYSYDWLDNRGHRSPQRLLDVAPPRPGEHFSTAGGRPLGCLLSIEPPVHYTGRIQATVASYVLVPIDAHTTRLLLKFVSDRYGWLSPALSIGDLVMARRQLLNLKRLAERTPDPHDDSP